MDFPVTLAQRDATLWEIERILAKGHVGAVMAEPIQGDAGIQVPAPGFFPRLKELLARERVLLIIDEVQSGMGRTGKWWAIEHENIIPDLTLTAKGLSAGYAPISAIIGREDVLNALAPAQHLFTYTGHPPSAAVALKVIQLIESHHVIDNAEIVGARLLSGLKQIQSTFPQTIAAVRGRGLMIGVEINRSGAKLAGKIFATRCVEKGVYVGYFGVHQNVLRIEPPLIMTETEADLVVETIDRVAEEMEHHQIPASTIEKVKHYAIGL